MTDLAAAEEFIELFHAENPNAGSVRDRIAWVRAEIDETGTYQHTEDELAFGARVAWRNSARCIGRLYWKSLRVRDLRSAEDASSVATHCAEHLRLATNKGKIRPLISVFAPDRPDAPGPRIYNDQLIRYAGYPEPDGSTVGDPQYTGFTKTVTAMGWQAPKSRGAFDVLPLLIETRDEGQLLFTLPRKVVKEVPLRHPEFDWFAELGLRWHAVPAISNMRLCIGGISYPAAPFNGWYMGTEIGARNLTDADRYDLLGVVADRLGLDRSDERTLWRDRAAVEINRAVLHSYAEDGVTITDHHTESHRFLAHVAKEGRAGRGCPADWSWIVPPMSGGLTPVFHRYYDDPETTGPQFVLDPESVQRGQHGGPRCFAEPERPRRDTAPVLVTGGSAG
ncbi:nitric oxide synthase oxygenase [Amycolatopsis sp. CA-230715]|uniref:nitric oxide synthase oxygenase n=1 Tax=Amycolatopsis sp. CA-230715 TaxID=2745196 RepID=UPI001C32FA20|nr:nitric oxide synthase oxygenase [Amycolatopsis sp. CA-230715]QWF84121.1 Nitric oxide synthase oxygenase [Amycolatopsis sp. CA-230715]